MANSYLSDEQIQLIQLIQDSFAKAAPVAPLLAERFYAQLFAQEPELRHLFKDDMGEQRRALMVTLGAIVSSLSNPQFLVPMAKKLGQRHVGYGVHAEHYGMVGTALLGALAMTLGADFTPAVREAWTEAYTVLSSVMAEAPAA
ncbi:globin family protein [Pseudorhodoferax sp.]|uniref:globin family protein n=1 Tax=Pseudorhodoferax sp. TaxID=1993553 RepID=UPI002DD69899|nr:globin family protein [Pseudorhodoferax sp.]